MRRCVGLGDGRNAGRAACQRSMPPFATHQRLIKSTGRARASWVCCNRKAGGAVSAGAGGRPACSPRFSVAAVLSFSLCVAARCRSGRSSCPRSWRRRRRGWTCCAACTRPRRTSCSGAGDAGARNQRTHAGGVHAWRWRCACGVVSTGTSRRRPSRWTLPCFAACNVQSCPTKRGPRGASSSI